MLRLKITGIVFIVFSVVFCSCNDNKNVSTPSFTDTVKINYWKTNYDSLFTLYRSSRKIDLLYPAGVFADSILSYNTVLIKDTGLRKIYFTILFYRAVNLNDLGYFVKSRELFDKYILLFQEYNLSEQKRLAYAQKTLGNIYSRYGDYKKTSGILQQSMQYYISVNDTVGVSSTILDLSIPLKELQQYNEAEQTLVQIFKLPSAEQKRKLKAHIELADIYIRQKKIQEAGLQIEKARQLLPSIAALNDRAEIYGLFFPCGE